MQRKEIKAGDYVKFFGAALLSPVFTKETHTFYESLTYDCYMPVYFVSEDQKWVHIKNEAGTQFVIDRRQVYKVRRKRKRREFWIKFLEPKVNINSYFIQAPIVLTEKPSDQENYIHVKEVLK